MTTDAGAPPPPPGAGSPPPPDGAPPGNRLPRGLVALGSSNFRLFWIGQSISQSGTWIHQIALSWLVLHLSNDPIMLALVVSAQFLPVEILGFWGGVVADAWPKRRTLIATSTAAAAIVLLIGLLVASGRAEAWHVLLLSLALGFVNAIDMPARHAFLGELVEPAAMRSAVGLDSAAYFGTRILGPALAGILIAADLLAVAFIANAASYVALAVIVAAIRPGALRVSPRAGTARRDVVRRFGEGLAYVRREPAVRRVLLLLLMVGSFCMNFSVVLPVLVRDELRLDGSAYGFLMSAMSVGALVGGLVIGLGLPLRATVLVSAGIAYGVGDVMLGVSRSFLASLFVMGGIGMAQILLAATASTLIQTRVPDELRGRVMSFYTAIMAGPSPVGALFSGGVAALAGAPAALIAGAAIGTGGGLLAWFVPGRRRRPSSPSESSSPAAARGRRKKA